MSITETLETNETSETLTNENEKHYEQFIRLQF